MDNNIFHHSPPSHLYSTAYCDSLMSFLFYNNVAEIYPQLAPTSSCSFDSSVLSTSPSQSLSGFKLPAADSISDFIRKSKTSTCQQDPLPTSLVIKCRPSLSLLKSNIIHSSLTLLVLFLLHFRQLLQLLFLKKKPGLDPNNFNKLQFLIYHFYQKQLLS